MPRSKKSKLELSEAVPSWISEISMVELFAGSAAATRAVLNFVERVKSHKIKTKMLIIDYETRSVLEASYPELVPLLAEGKVLHYQFSLAQAKERDIPAVVEGLLGIQWRKINIVHVGLDCRSFSWAALAAVRHRSPKGAAITLLAQDYEKILAHLCELITDLTKVNPTVLATFENPRHGSFKEHELVQALIRRPGWHMATFDYCAMAMETYDGKIGGPKERRTGGLTAQKPSVVVVHGTDENPQSRMYQCRGRDCRMVVPGTKHHVLVICGRSEGLRFGQRQIEESAKQVMPQGVYIQLLRCHFEWLNLRDGHDFRCYKCGQREGELARCDSFRCTKVQHLTCDSIQPTSEELWFCDVCHLQMPELLHLAREQAAGKTPPIPESMLPTLFELGDGPILHSLGIINNYEARRVEGSTLNGEGR